MLVERQVFVTWYRPEEKLPEDGIFKPVTVSGRVRNITFDHSLAIGAYFSGEGWYFDFCKTQEEMDQIVVHAWCDLEPYGGKK